MFPVQIQFRDIPESDFVWNAVLSHAEKLQRFYERIISCRVTFSAPHQRRNQGQFYHVQIELEVPGGGIFVTSEPERNHAHEDAYIAIRDAFETAQRRLEDFIRKKRGVRKAHEGLAHGKVVRIFRDDGYGFIVSTENREIYFHENSVLHNSFDRLRIGDEVRFSEEMGEKGPQVTSMSILGPDGHLESRKLFPPRRK